MCRFGRWEDRSLRKESLKIGKGRGKLVEHDPEAGEETGSKAWGEGERGKGLLTALAQKCREEVG